MTNFETEIRENGYIVYKNNGDSMMPLLRENRDLVVISAVTRPLCKRDVVLFKRENGTYALHRITGKRRDGTLLIGGDNRCFSEPVPEEWVIGILTAVVRDGNKISVTDKQYIRYVKKVPYRRLWLKIKSFPYTVFKKIRKIFRRNKK